MKCVCVNYRYYKIKCSATVLIKIIMKSRNKRTFAYDKIMTSESWLYCCLRKYWIILFRRKKKDDIKYNYIHRDNEINEKVLKHNIIW